MNARTWITVSLALAAIGGGLFAFRQQAEIAQLRGHTAALATARAAQARSATPVPKTGSAAETLSEQEKLELLRLRGEATRLRERVRGLSGLRVENEKLRAGVKAAGQPGAGPGLPAGYVRRRDAQFAGYGSPEATLRSLLWAIEHQDTNSLLAAFDAEHSQGMRDALAREGAEEFWKETGVIPGCRIVATEQVADDEVDLKVEFAPGDTPQSMRFKRVGDDWKLRR